MKAALSILDKVVIGSILLFVGFSVGNPDVGVAMLETGIQGIRSVTIGLFE